VSDGCFYETGSFRVALPPERKGLEKLFRSMVLKLLLAKGKIIPGIITMLDSWKHTGFKVFCGDRIYPNDDTAMENLARYIIRASFSQERMTYLRNEATVVYRAKKGPESKIFDDHEWLAAMPARRSFAKAGAHIFPIGASRWCATAPVPQQHAGAITVMSVEASGRRKKLILLIPCIIESAAGSPAKRKS